jgi:hypothetical protein
MLVPVALDGFANGRPESDALAGGSSLGPESLFLGLNLLARERTWDRVAVSDPADAEVDEPRTAVPPTGQRGADRARDKRRDWGRA